MDEKSESLSILQREMHENKESLEKIKVENQVLLTKNEDLEKKIQESKSIINDNNHGNYLNVIW